MTNERAAQVLIAAYSFIVNQCDNQFIDNYEVACAKAVGLLMNTPDIIGETEEWIFFKDFLGI